MERTFAQTGRRISACAASSLLEMQRALATTPASDMSLVVPLTEAGSTLAYHLKQQHHLRHTDQLLKEHQLA
jgi:hypothetical protein